MIIILVLMVTSMIMMISIVIWIINILIISIMAITMMTINLRSTNIVIIHQLNYETEHKYDKLMNRCWGRPGIPIRP